MAGGTRVATSRRRRHARAYPGSGSVHARVWPPLRGALVVSPGGVVFLGERGSMSYTMAPPLASR